MHEMRLRTLEIDAKEMKEAVGKAIPMLAANQDHFARQISLLHAGISTVVQELERVKAFIEMPTPGGPRRLQNRGRLK